jgi:hypothetical protein
MASYQNIDTRLRVMEDMLLFVMSNMHMKAAISSGLTGPDGRPLPGKVVEGSLLDFYRASRSLPVVTQSENAPPPPVEENNG